MSNSSRSSGGIGLVTVLTVTFVLLKAFGKIAWSWISTLFWLVVAIIALIISLIVSKE